MRRPILFAFALRPLPVWLECVIVGALGLAAAFALIPLVS